MYAFFAIALVLGLGWAFASNAEKSKKLPPKGPAIPPLTSLPDPFGPTSPGQPTGSGSRVPPPDVQKQIDRYLNEVNDPLTLEFAASMLEARGFTEAAELLKAKAKAIRLGVDPFGGSKSPGLPTF